MGLSTNLVTARWSSFGGLVDTAWDPKRHGRAQRWRAGPLEPRRLGLSRADRDRERRLGPIHHHGPRRNHAKSMLDMARTRDDWFSEVLPVNVTGAMSEAAVEQQRVEYTGIFGKEAADALIDQEFYCSFEAAILGAYWGKEILLAEQT